jgi:hypothetical protein
MVVSLRGVKAAARRLRGGLRASLDSSTLKDAVRDTCKKWSQAIGISARARTACKPKAQKIPRTLDGRSQWHWEQSDGKSR